MLELIRNNLPSAKPELWRSLPGCLWRKFLTTSLSGTVIATADSDLHMEVDLADAIGRTIYVYGCWEYPMSRFLESYLKPHMTFLDIGANIGYFALFAAKRCRAVYAIEAGRTQYARFIRNLSLNPTHNIRAFQLAASDKSGPITFYVDDDPSNHGLSSLIRKTNHSVTVEAVTLDEFCAPLPKIDIMKIDVEGAEEQVFRGARQFFERDRPDILFESHPDAVAHRLLRECGYSISKLPSRSYEAPNCFASKTNHF